MFKFSLTLCCWLGAVGLFAQEFMKFGKVPDEDLKSTVYERDTSAPAVVLGDYGVMNIEPVGDGYGLRFERHRRVKILNAAGLKYADVVIPYYHEGSPPEKVAQIRALSISPDGEVTKLGKKDYFREKINEYWSAVKFSIPDVQPGSVIEYTYVHTSSRLVELPKWTFQEEIPVRKSVLEIVYPEFFDYIYLINGLDGMTPVPQSDGSQLYSGPKGQFRVKKGYYEMTNAVALHEEPYMTTLSDYQTSIRFQLNRLRYGTYEEPVLTTWPKLAAELEGHDDFGKYYQYKGNYRKAWEAVEPLLAVLESEKDRARAIYYHLSNRLKWDGNYLALAEASPNEVYESAGGSSTDLNLLLLALLREAGLKAFPMLTSTRSHGKMYPLYPLFDQFNHTLVWVETGGKGQVLDLGDPLRPFGLPAVECLNGQGWVVDGENSRWVPIVPPRGMDVLQVEARLDEDGTLRGKAEGAYRGYNAIPERAHHRQNPDAQYWQERLAQNFPEARISEVECENLEDLEKNFKVRFSFEIPEAAMSTDEFLYLTPVLYSSFQEPIFQLEERYFPVEIPYPFLEQFQLRLELPEGYVLEDQPQPVRFKMPQGAGDFLFTVTELPDNALEVQARLSIKKLQYQPPGEYASIKELFDLVAQKLGEQLVLKSKDY